METLIKADIFFFISGVTTVILTILIAVLLFYLIKAGKNLYLISVALKENYKDSEEFVLELIERLENNLVFRMFFPPLRKKRHTSNKSGIINE